MQTSAAVTMTPEQQTEVWAMLDKPFLAEVVQRTPTPIFASISGAHLYGFASLTATSIFVERFSCLQRSYWACDPPAETFTIEDKSVIDLDWVAHDLRKFAGRVVLNARGGPVV